MTLNRPSANSETYSDAGKQQTLMAQQWRSLSSLDRNAALDCEKLKLRAAGLEPQQGRPRKQA